MSTTTQYSKDSDKQGEFVRQESIFRRWITTDGSSEFEAEPDRYHLYVSYACPWAHRAIIVRKLKGLQDVIGMTVVDPIRDDRGWAFTEAVGGPDPIEGFEFLSEAYKKTDPSFDDRVTVPTLWDTKTKTIVNNESSEIIRMLNSEFNEWAKAPELDLYPQELREDIDEINDYVYKNINNGVYRCGFARSQKAYESAFHSLFSALDTIDQRLEDQCYLMGDIITEADWRLFTTLVRFDAVYVGHFKCNKKRIADYKHLQPYLLRLINQEDIKDTVNMDHIKRHYYETHETLNPSGVVPLGPDLGFID